MKKLALPLATCITTAVSLAGCYAYPYPYAAAPYTVPGAPALSSGSESACNRARPGAISRARLPPRQLLPR